MFVPAATGTVADSSGAIVASATVIAENSNTGVKTTVNPTLVGELSKGVGRAQVGPTGVNYFDGLNWVPDPAVANLTTAQGLRARLTTDRPECGETFPDQRVQELRASRRFHRRLQLAAVGRPQSQYQ
ncbi:MAG TPA: hypothetical protein VJ302_27180 [Blastocatellia bacterium]|nr:hypothetical protein [Blastocatellia bacterium]